MELGHLLTCSGLTYLEVSSEVCHDSFCQLGNSASSLHTPKITADLYDEIKTRKIVGHILPSSERTLSYWLFTDSLPLTWSHANKQAYL